MTINAGDKVTVKMYTGEKQGTVSEVMPNYGFNGMGQETKYRISGDGFVTICSERIIKNGSK
jgi:hypothetical protein